MKKIISLLIMVTLIFSSMIPSIAAATTSVNATINASKVVTIEGNINTGAGKQVAVRVIGPDGIMNYLGQATSGSNGSFVFTYLLKSGAAEGTYSVEVDSQGIQTVSTTFVYNSVIPTPTPTSTPTPTNEVVVTGDKVTIKTNPIIDATGAATVEITASTLKDAMNKAKVAENGVKKVEINVQKTSGVGEYKLVLPTASITSGSSKEVFEIKTDVAVLEIPTNMLQNDLTKGTPKVTISIAPADITKVSTSNKEKIGNRPIIELKLLVDDKQVEWNNPDAPVTVSIDYTPTEKEIKNPEHIVIWYLDGQGKIIAVPNGKYDINSGKVAFNTTHFSKYAVSYVEKTFNDIASYPWAKKQIEVMASKGVIGGTSATTYSPSNDITRADFMVLLVKALGLSAEVNSNFADIDSTAYFAEAVGIAKKLGITTGRGNNKFDPKANITRQEMMTLICKAMEVANKDLDKGTYADIEKFTDKSEVADYAVQSVETLVRNGIVTGDGTKINPRGYATRAETAVMIYKIYNK